MENKTLDIVNLIDNNPLINLNRTYQSKFITKIKEKFTEPQQQIFAASFYAYLNYSKTDFVIVFNDIWKWLGFERKEFCKRVLVKHFKQDVDYKIFTEELGEETILLQPEENKINQETRGRKSEKILININTFKKLSLKSNTKKADEIHDYYIKLEETYQETMSEESHELRMQLEQKEQLLIEKVLENKDKQYELEQTQIELKKEQDKKNLLLNRRYHNAKKGDAVYYYVDGDNNDKIGKSKGIANREYQYSGLSHSGKMIHIRHCLNCNLTEKVLHHILDKYRSVRSTEWFDFPSQEFAIKVIDTVVLFLDSQMESMEEFIPEMYQSMINIIGEKNIEKAQEIKEVVPVIKKIKQVDPKDFEKFILECCEISENENCPKTELKQAHRVWSSCNTKEVIDLLNEFLKNKFTSTTIFIDDVRRNVYKNVKLKPLVFTIQNEKPLDYEQFIIEKCKTDYQYRTSYLDFFNAFCQWKRINDPNYKLPVQYRKEIQTYLENKFAGGRVHISSGTKTMHLHGIWGCGFSDNKFGLKVADRTNKIVSKTNVETGVVLETWTSLSLASRELKIPISTLSNYTRFENVINGYVYKYVEI